MMRAIALLLLLAAAQGCVVPAGLAPSTEPLEPGTYTVIGEEVAGSKWGFAILFLPFTPPNPAGKARDEAMEKAGADALINVAVDVAQFNLLLVHFVRTAVYGTPVKLN